MKDTYLKEALKVWDEEIKEADRVNDFLKSLKICKHDSIAWVSDLKRLGKCKDCEKVKTIEEFEKDWSFVYYIADKKLKSFMSHYFESPSFY